MIKITVQVCECVCVVRVCSLVYLLLRRVLKLIKQNKKHKVTTTTKHIKYNKSLNNLLSDSTEIYPPPLSYYILTL